MPETSREFIVVLPDDNQFTVPVQVIPPHYNVVTVLVESCMYIKQHFLSLCVNPLRLAYVDFI